MKKTKKKNSFGVKLRNLRLDRSLSIRELCKTTGYDPSNWSKIERGVLPPPIRKNILIRWAKALGLVLKDEIREFIDIAQLSQGIVPEDLQNDKNLIKTLPAFFRTIRNEKPSKEEIDELIKLLKEG